MAPSLFSRSRDDSNNGGADALDRAPLMALLEPDLRQRVRKRMNRRKILAGKPVYRQGEDPDALYVVESGRFRVYVGERAGHERVLHFLGPGETIGEGPFMAETPYVTTAVAVEEGSVWRLARADFEALLGAHDGLLRYLAGIVAQRQAEATARLAFEKVPDEARSLRGFVTAVFSPRGGAGVTTIALNLAIALAEGHPDDTVLMDLDVLFGHAAANLWLDTRGVLAHLSPATVRTLDRSGLDFYLTRHASSLRIFPAATHPEEGQAITGDHVRASVATLRRSFGHIVLDLPHAFNEVTLAGLELAERVLLVATPEQAILNDVLESRRIFGDVLHLPLERLTYVLNHPLPYAALRVGDFAAATATDWLEIASGGEAPSTAAARGESLLDSRPNNPVARAVAALAEDIGRQARELAALSARPG